MPASFLQTPLEPPMLAGFWRFAELNDLSPSSALRLVVHRILEQANLSPDDYDPTKERRGNFQNWSRRRRKAIDENGIHPVLIVRVTPSFKEAFAQYAAARNESAPGALTAIVRHVLATAKIATADLPRLKVPERRSERVAVRFSKVEMAAMQKHAGEFGSVRGWLVALVRANLSPEIPQFSPRALEILYESNRELGSIGRNINQIAHALNLELQQVGQPRTSPNLAQELSDLKASIRAHTDRVLAVCVESTARWNSIPVR